MHAAAYGAVFAATIAFICPSASAAPPDEAMAGGPASDTSASDRSPSDTSASDTSASEGRGPLRVGISPFAPFIFTAETAEAPPRGFSIELWKHIAEKLGRDYEFVQAEGVAEKLQLLHTGRIDVAIGGISVTRAREEAADFTHATIRSGLGILVRAEDREYLGFWQRLHLRQSNWMLIIGFVVLVILSGHLMWLAERGRDAFHDKYFPGVLEGMYWAIVTASTVGYGDKAPVRWRGRLVAALAIVISLPLFALFTAELASTITVAEIDARIVGPGDLSGKRVGVVRGTSSATWTSESGLTLYQWDRAEDVYRALKDKNIDAMIYDAPNLKYYAQHDGRGLVKVVGGEFRSHNLAMAVAEGSPLREEINRAILDLVESKEMQRLQIDWFGTEE